MTVVSPGDAWEAAEAAEALANTPGTTYVRLERTGAVCPHRADETFTLGKARTIRHGSDVTLVATGGILEEAIKAADDLALAGMRCRVISMHTIKPLDVELLTRAARETGGLVSIEEHTVLGGLGAAIAESLLESGAVPGFFYRIGLRDQFSSVVGSQSYLRERFGMDAAAIAARVRSLLSDQASAQRRARRVA